MLTLVLEDKRPGFYTKKMVGEMDLGERKKRDSYDLKQT